MHIEDDMYASSSKRSSVMRPCICPGWYPRILSGTCRNVLLSSSQQVSRFLSRLSAATSAFCGFTANVRKPSPWLFRRQPVGDWPLCQGS